MPKPRINPHATHCVQEGCDREIKTAGLCNKHYTALAKIRASAKKRNRCAEPGCSGEHKAKGYCALHYAGVWQSRPKEVVKGSRLPKCEKPNCMTTSYARGLCRAHYKKWQLDNPDWGIDYDDYWTWVKGYLKL